jgi:hypothetical protein
MGGAYPVDRPVGRAIVDEDNLLRRQGLDLQAGEALVEKLAPIPVDDDNRNAIVVGTGKLLTG